MAAAAPRDSVAVFMECVAAQRLDAAHARELAERYRAYHRALVDTPARRHWLNTVAVKDYHDGATGGRVGGRDTRAGLAGLAGAMGGVDGHAARPPRDAHARALAHARSRAHALSPSRPTPPAQ
jgi:hypothetical protein